MYVLGGDTTYIYLVRVINISYVGHFVNAELPDIYPTIHVLKRKQFSTCSTSLEQTVALLRTDVWIT
jgi:hypothetical protein